MKRHHRLLLLAALIAALVLFFWPRSASATPPVGTTDRSAVATGGLDSFEQRCEAQLRPSVRVTASPLRYVLNNKLSTRLLSNRAAYASSVHTIMGMTFSSTHADISLDGPALIDAAKGRECIAPRIEVELSFQPLEVFVAREFSPQSCAYREVLAHEMKHVKIYADNLTRIEGMVRSALARRYEDRPVYAPAGRGLATVQDDIDAWLGTMLREELAKVELMQVQLDGTDETERLSHACMGEVASMMGSSF